MAIDIRHGLSHQAASVRLAREGYNQLPSAEPRSPFGIALDVLKEPMFLLLIACGSLYLMLGDKGEAMMLLGFVFVIIAISFFQKRKTERALQALCDLSSPRAVVIRDGAQHRIPGREVVRDDLLVLSEGDRVPADAVLLSGTNVSIDESLLTGESAPVRKTAAEARPAQMSRPGGDNLSYLFSGTLLVQGRGIAQVLAVGQQTALGAIGKSLAGVAPEPTRIQRETRMIVTRAAWVGMILAVAAGALYGATRSDWLNGFLVGITLAMALLPEELPVVLTLFLGLGAWRMAQKQVLTRHIPAIEMLGAATVLCVDKTGTLTQNRMALAKLYAHAERFDFAQHGQLPETFHEVLEFGMLASHRDPFDPMERAINRATREALQGTEHIHQDWTLVEEYPLSSGLLAMSRVWQSPDREHYVIAAKGSPEAIIDLCHLDHDRGAVLATEATAMAEQGLRVLGVARASFRKADLPAIQHDFEFEFLGLLGLADPIRPAVPAAIEESHAAGMRVIMITGDYPATALSIARQVGLRAEGGMMSGDELDSLNDAELQARVKHVHVFCRTMPEQKLRLVNALKAGGEIVAMTGDGVNDAPALKAAHIGIAMGAHGTDVARESADLVLLDDDFSSIVAAVRMGRRIFDNLRKAITFLVGAHVPIVGISVLPVALGWPLLLLPVHILFLQLIIDPACSIVFEAEPDEADIMRRPPRSPAASLFDRHIMLLGLLQGMALLATLLAVYIGARHFGRSADAARALTFSTMVIANLGLIFASRSRSRSILATLGTRNRALWWVIGGAVLFMTLVLVVPGLRALFYFGALQPADLAIMGIAGAVCIAAFETARRFGGFGSDA
ncbi:MAG TPA: cation-translocating P-type ATPase [Novimethylophilus sp.]|uniref:cation-translocating P-type ATPase n=1 Tax=Novimethylophilus sp. TaxID=2137426 RepID=UPI002F3F7752